MAVKRTSGTDDIIPCNMPVVLKRKIKIGDKLCLIGQVRTYNKVVEKKNRLIIVFFALDIAEYTGYENDIKLVGFFCRQPVHRLTPLGRDICDAQVAVNRDRQKSDYIPIIVWGRTARLVGMLEVGAHISLEGRLQSRIYQKATEHGIVERTAYEVSVVRIAEVEDVE